MPNLHTYLHPGVKGMQIRQLPPLLRFIPQFAQICIVFALSKFEANPFFRPVEDHAFVLGCKDGWCVSLYFLPSRPTLPSIARIVHTPYCVCED